MITENVKIALIVATPAALASLGGIIIPLIGMWKHRNHESVSDDTNAKLTILLNGGLKKRIEDIIQEQMKGTNRDEV